MSIMSYLKNQQALEIMKEIISDVENASSIEEYMSSLSDEEKNAHLQLFFAMKKLTNLSLAV